MSQPLLTIVGAMFTDRDFRTEMLRSRHNTLKAYGFLTLSPDDYRNLDKILDDFGRGTFDATVEKIDAYCPFWPCPWMKLARASDGD